jgi:putative polyhydroxyalkanoate system protein
VRATRAVNAVAAQLQQEYGIQSRWEESALYFRGNGVSGRLRLHPRQLRLDVELGLLMAPFRNSICAAIEQKLDRELAVRRSRRLSAPAK